MTKSCRVCSSRYEPSPSQLKRSDFICPPCKAGKDRDSRERRKAAGISVSGKAMPRKYHQTYQKIYKTRPEVKERKRKEAHIRRQDPTERVKQSARRSVRNEIEAGRMIRMPCEVCGHFPTDGHHDDYSRPLSVRWLCRLHHREHHAKEMAMKRKLPE